MSDREID